MNIRPVGAELFTRTDEKNGQTWWSW